MKKSYKMISAVGAAAAVTAVAVAPVSAANANVGQITFADNTNVSNATLNALKLNKNHKDYVTYFNDNGSLKKSVSTVEIGDAKYNFNDLNAAKLGNPSGTLEDWINKVEPVSDEFKVEGITSIQKTGVDVNFPSLKQDLTDVTINVLDPNGKTIAVKAQNLAKGATSATFTFETALNEVIEGTWTVDGVEFVENNSVKVESVKAINETGITVTFPALKEAQEGATIKVVDPSGKTVGVSPVNLEVGDESATFDFVKAYDELPLGTFTVEGKEFDTAAVAAVDKVKSATNVVSLYSALQSKYFEGVTEDNIEAYKTAISDAGDAVKTVADVNKIVSDVNKAQSDASAEATVVKKVVDAKNNLQLFNALQDSAFSRVNADWITDYATSTVTSVDGSTTNNLEDLSSANYFGTTDTGVTVEAIQEAIDSVNLTKVAPSVQAAEMTLDADKVSTARALVNKYLPASTTDAPGAKEYGLDILKQEDALIAVNNANTNAKLKSALTNLVALENTLVEKYDGLNKDDIIPGLAQTAAFSQELTADIADANLTDYREAIKAETDVTKKNQRKDINSIINGVNTSFGTLKAEESKVAASSTAQPKFTIKALQKNGQLDASKGAATAIKVTINGVTQDYKVTSGNDFNSGTNGELKIESNDTGFNLSKVGTETEATITLKSDGNDYTVKAPVKVTAGDAANTQTSATLKVTNLPGTEASYASGDDITAKFTLKDAGNNTVTTKDGTYASTITVGTDKFYQNIKVVNGEVSLTVPARTAQAGVKPVITFTPKDGSLVTVTAPETEKFTIVAGEFSNLTVSEPATTGFKITATDGVNKITDLGTKVVNLKISEVDAEGNETPVNTSSVTDYQGNLSAAFSSGDYSVNKAGLLEAGKTYKVTVTVGDVTTTKTITVAS